MTSRSQRPGSAGRFDQQVVFTREILIPGSLADVGVCSHHQIRAACDGTDISATGGRFDLQHQAGRGTSLSRRKVDRATLPLVAVLDQPTLTGPGAVEDGGHIGGDVEADVTRLTAENGGGRRGVGGPRQQRWVRRVHVPGRSASAIGTAVVDVGVQRAVPSRLVLRAVSQQAVYRDGATAAPVRSGRVDRELQLSRNQPSAADRRNQRGLVKEQECATCARRLDGENGVAARILIGGAASHVGVTYSGQRVGVPSAARAVPN